MPSTNKTPNLNLNRWIDSDLPKRTDFVSDNNIIDSVLGGHVNDTGMHLTSEEKQRASEPFKVITVYGTGESTTVVNPGFVPKAVIYCKKNAPFCETENGYTRVNSGIATSAGTTGGITISNNSFIVTQSSTPSDGVQYSLNEQYAQYIAIVFR